MAMVLGVGQLTIHIPESHSLKDKRRVIRSITQRVRSRFDVAIAEVDDQQFWQSATIGIVAVSNSGQHADEVIQRVIAFVEQNLQSGYVIDVSHRDLHMGSTERVLPGGDTMNADPVTPDSAAV